MNRLMLRMIDYNDMTHLINYAGDLRVSKTTLKIPHPFTENDALALIESAKKGVINKKLYHYAIIALSHKEFIGCIELRINESQNSADLGYWLGFPFWNKGYATQAVMQIIDIAFNELAISKVYASHLADNIASGKVLIKCGFKLIQDSNGKANKNIVTYYINS